MGSNQRRYSLQRNKERRRDLYLNRKTETVIIMARLSAEEQREYEEEVEYQQEHQPGSTRYSKPSAMQRITAAVKGAAQKVNEFEKGPTGQKIRSFAEKVNASDGFESRGHPPPPAASRIRQQPNSTVQLNQGSSLHPRVSIIVQGKLVGPAVRGQEPRRRRMQQQDTGLGGVGFGGNDRGL